MAANCGPVTVTDGDTSPPPGDGDEGIPSAVKVAGGLVVGGLAGVATNLR